MSFFMTKQNNETANQRITKAVWLANGDHEIFQRRIPVFHLMTLKTIAPFTNGVFKGRNCFV